MDHEEIKEEIKKYLETGEQKMIQKSMRCSKSSSKIKNYTDTNKPQETWKISNEQLNLHLKELGKRWTNKTQS